MCGIACFELGTLLRQSGRGIIAARGRESRRVWRKEVAGCGIDRD